MRVQYQCHNKILLSGNEWYRCLQEIYGIENVNWNVSSFDDIMRYPTSLREYTVDEITDVLGDGWIRGTYGSNGSGWKFIEKKHPDNMIFFHGGGGWREGVYYVIRFGGKNGGRIKIVDINTYVPDAAIIIYNKDR